MHRRIVIGACALLVLVACGQFRRHGDVYRGIGAYRASSQYHSASNPDQPLYSETSSLNRSYVPSSGFRMYWPVRRVRLNRGFRPANDRDHAGIDLGGTRGTPILAAHEGQVIYAGQGFRGYGKLVILEYDGQWASLYAHLNDVAVRPGMILKPGDPIGAMGRTGRATGVHLHFELMHFRQPVDPLPYLGRGQSLASRAPTN